MAPETPPAPAREVAPNGGDAARIVMRLRGIRKAFGDKVVLDGLDLEVRKSEILVILGRSGGGKSVTLKTLAGLVRPDAGEVMAFKQDVLALDERELRRLR